MVDRSYMLQQPPKPSLAMQVLDQRVIPVAIDVAASLEGALERAAVAARRSPVVALAAALGCGWLVAALLRRRPA